MVLEMSYTTVSHVINSWEKIRRIENHEQIIGVMLFKKFFELEPSAKDIFGLGKDDSGTKLIENKKFRKHAIYFIQMLHKALDFLGPDIELLTEMLLELGAKHVHYGVKPWYFPSMGRALLHSLQDALGESLQDALGEEFTQQTRDAWVEVYGAMSYDMIRVQNKSMLSEEGLGVTNS